MRRSDAWSLSDRGQNYANLLSFHAARGAQLRSLHDPHPKIARRFRITSRLA
jgi:hypothetical protein